MTYVGNKKKQTLSPTPQRLKDLQQTLGNPLSSLHTDRSEHSANLNMRFVHVHYGNRKLLLTRYFSLCYLRCDATLYFEGRRSFMVFPRQQSGEGSLFVRLQLEFHRNKLRLDFFKLLPMWHPASAVICKCNRIRVLLLLFLVILIQASNGKAKMLPPLGLSFFFFFFSESLVSHFPL